jgi:glycosyltransferase involved in cell wall biosynthesis
MSILFICHSFPPSPYAFGGTELYALHMAKALLKRGIHVAVMTPLYESLVMQPGTIRKTSYEGVDLIQLRISHFISLSSTLWNPELGEKIAAWIEEHPFDLVHVQYPLGIGLVAAEALTRHDKLPTLLTLHDASLFCDQGHLRETGKLELCSGPETPKKCGDCHRAGNRHSVEASTAPELLERIFNLRDKTVKLLMERLQRVLVPTEFLYRYLERFNYPLTNVKKTPLGTKLFNALPHKPGELVRFVYLGNIVSVKGVDVLLEAFQSIAPRDAELHLYGRSFSGPLLDSLKPCLEQPNVFYHGPYNHQDLPVILQSADIGVLPSYSENYPTVAREFFNASVPVIASRVGGIPEIVKDGVNGLLFESGNIQQLHRHLRTAIEHPEIFHGFKKKIDPIFSIEDDATSTLKLYDSIVQGSSPEDLPFKREQQRAAPPGGRSPAGI